MPSFEKAGDCSKIVLLGTGYLRGDSYEWGSSRFILSVLMYRRRRENQAATGAAIENTAPWPAAEMNE